MTVSELDILSRTERSRVFEFAAAILGFSVVLIVATAVLGWTMQADLRWVIVMWCVSAGVLVGLLLGFGMFRIWGKLDGAEEARNRASARYVPEIDVTPPTPTILPDALPALPAENDTIRVTLNGVGEDIPRKEVQGFDPRDLAYLFRALARGEKFTEANLERWELPYSRVVMGKAQEGTPYFRFIDLCVKAGIIGGREPKKSGVLVVTDALEMMRLVKLLPEPDTTP